MVLASTVVASMSAQTPAAGHLRVVDAPKFSAMPHAVLFDNALSAGARLLYAGLQTYWWKSGECFASHATLGRDFGVSERQIQRYLGELMKAGHIVERRYGRGQSKVYAPAKHDTDVVLESGNTTDLSPLAPNTTDLSVKHDRFVAGNTTDLSPISRCTEEDSLKEEDPIVGGADAPRRPRKGTSERRASRLADDAALTDEHVQAAEAIGLSRTAAGAEWAQFKDYHRAKGSTMLDWLAAWRTWCRNSLKFGARQKPMRGAKTQDTETPLKPTDMSCWSVRRYP